MAGFDFASLFTQIVQGVQGTLVTSIMQFVQALLASIFGTV